MQVYRFTAQTNRTTERGFPGIQEGALHGAVLCYGHGQRIAVDFEVEAESLTMALSTAIHDLDELGLGCREFTDIGGAA